jgi:ABC-type branched-subunit amino acid transport system ATPase component
MRLALRATANEFLVVGSQGNALLRKKCHKTFNESLALAPQHKNIFARLQVGQVIRVEREKDLRILAAAR